MENKIIESQFQQHLQLLLNSHQSNSVYQYALFPSGKLFRANLVWAILKDLSPDTYLKSSIDIYSAHALLSSSIECHHTYTLLHDDLPAMDNDTMRRGKLCTHLKFSEWQSLLTGDGLLILSFQLLSKIRNNNPERFLELLAFFTWATGPKGLIHGQYLDLSHTTFQHLDEILLIHELKTARLIQVAILGSAILATNKNRKLEKKLWRYSRDLGINFQLLDDLSELSELPLSEHEQKINPWFLFPNETLNLLISKLDEFEKNSTDLNLSETKQIISAYYLKMVNHFENNLKIDLDILPIILRLKRFCN
jgi:geranylgeranyl pyrophosphate synthase